MSKPLTVAITGGMGSGKTTVLNYFKDFNIPTYIADEEAKGLMQKDEGLIVAIKQNFGEDAYEKNGRLNKSYLADQVFGKPKQLEKLNSLVHPAVRKHFQSWLGKQNSPYVIYESALIFEHNQQDMFDIMILVTAPKQLRIERIKNRNHWSEKHIQNRMKNQMDDNLKKEHVNFIIENIDKSLIKKETLKIHNYILNINR